MGLKENEKLYKAIPLSKKVKAITMLIKELPTEDIVKIKEEVEKDPEHWFAPYHFYWGMTVRNLLRNKGFGEEYFGVTNLDDIYVELVEDALKEV